jgi:hypothetical protein
VAVPELQDCWAAGPGKAAARSTTLRVYAAWRSTDNGGNYVRPLATYQPTTDDCLPLSA